MDFSISLDDLNGVTEDKNVTSDVKQNVEVKSSNTTSSFEISGEDVFSNRESTPVTVDSVGNEDIVLDDRAPTDQEEEDYFYARRGIEDEEDQDLTVQGQKVLKQRLDVAFAGAKAEADRQIKEQDDYADKFAFMKKAGGFAGQSKAAIAYDKIKDDPKVSNALETRFKDQLNSRYNTLSDILAGKEFEGKSGVTDSEKVNQYSNSIRKKIVLTMLDKGYDVNTISHTVGAAEFSPFLGTAIGITDLPKTLAEARALNEEGMVGMSRLLKTVAGLEVVAGAVGAGFIVKGAANALGITSKSARALDAKGTDELRQGLGSDSSLITDPKASSTSETMKKIIDADITSTETTVKAAREVVETVEGKELSQKVIREFEEANEVNVTDVDADTDDLVINQQKARDAGRDTANTAMNLQATRSADEAAIISKGESFSGEREFTDSEAFLDVGEDADALLSPILKPEKFNAIVAIAKDFKANNPNSWKDVDEFGNNKTVIDNLFELTVGKNIDENQELADSLAKYGLTFDEYVMTVVSGGSDAGKILNKLSQIKRAGHLDNVDKLKNKAIENGQNSIMRGFRRLENIRRGGMVSMIKTAARNLQSATIRAPMEALENVMDTALVRMSEDGVGAGLMSLVDYQGNWKGSLSHLKYMYRDPVLSKKLTDHILDRPEFEKQYTNLFDNVNEYQKATGRGEGGAFDTVVSKIEDLVTFANTPNRIQEYLVRRGAFMGELERLVKREYDIDLLDALKDGKLRDLMANSSTVRPKGKAQFEDLIETSVRRALDVTYAKSPDVKIFRNASNFITRNGLTTVIEFPRFMFNSLELMGQYSAGAFNPALQRYVFKTKNRGPLDSKDRQNITRNMTGLMAITAAYQYRTSDDAPALYNELNTGNGSVMDTTPQFPLRQMLWIGEAIKQLGPNAGYLPQVQLATLGQTQELQGTYNNWQGAKVDEILETFGGSSMRTGASNVFIDQIGDIISDAGDVKGNDELGKLLGATVGNYLASWGVPIAQVIEAQRISGDRPMTYEDRSGDYELKDFGESFTSNVKRAFTQRYGNLADPSSIEDMPKREGLFDPEGGKTRVGAVGSGLLGLTRYTGNSESAEYLIRKGFNDWEIGSRDPVKKVRNEANKLMRKELPTVVNAVRRFETRLRKEYMDMPANSEYKLDNTVDQFVNRRVRPMIKGYMQDLQSHVKLAADGKATFEELATRTFNKMPEEDRVRALDEYNFMQSKLPEKDKEPFDIKNGSHLLMLKALDEALGQSDTFN